jgi:hypothetical protein
LPPEPLEAQNNINEIRKVEAQLQALIDNLNQFVKTS